MSRQAVTIGRKEHVHTPHFSEKKNYKKKEYEVFGGGHATQYEVFESIRDNATNVKEQNSKYKTMPLESSSLDSPSKNKKINLLNIPLNMFKKSKNPANQSENISRENENYSEVKNPEREYFAIPDCTFPSPTGPVGLSAMTLVDGNEKNYYGLGDVEYEIENDYDEIDSDKIHATLPLELITPQNRNSLPFYCSHEKSIKKETSPPPVPTRTPTSPTTTIWAQKPTTVPVPIHAPEPMRTPTPCEPLEEYMDMESAQELRDSIIETTPEMECKFKTDLSTQINKFESKKGCYSVVPPLRRTIHHETVHSHSLKILRDEYQNKIPQPPKRITSLAKDDEPFYIKEEPAQLMRKKSGYEKVSKFSPVKPPNKATKPNADIAKNAQVTKNESIETSDVSLVNQSKDRNMFIKILNTKQAPSANINSHQQENFSPENTGEEISKKAPSPTKKVPPKIPEKVKLLPSPQTGPEPILPKPLKSRDSDVGTLSGLDTAKTEGNVPKAIERNRGKRMNTDINLRKKAPAAGPKPGRAKSFVNLHPPDQGKKGSEQKEELKSESMKFTNELQKRLQKPWNPESNYYVQEPRH